VDEAPWNKDQQLPPSSKGSHNYIEPVMFPSSHTAPYATFDNQIAPEVLFPYYSSPNSSTYHYMMLLYDVFSFINTCKVFENISILVFDFVKED
jgi:hypothetical protein